MCGICGIATAGTVGDDLIARVRTMNAALAHRGPDDEGLWRGDHAIIAARRLSVIDVAHGAQPMTSGPWTLASNGEIYNFRDLRAQLEKRGVRFRTDSDTEAALEAFATHGEDALERLQGMFAIAAWDASRERLILARDRIGIKPLYYTEHEGVFAFASEMDALLAGGFVSGELNAAALDAYFAYAAIPAPDSIFRGVYKLRPGEKLIYEKGAWRTETWWRPEVAIDPAWTLETAADSFGQLLRESVRAHLITDVPVGVFLSGGIDSSAITAAMAEVADGRVQTFSIGFEDAAANELPYARAVATAFGTDHHEEIVRPDAAALLPELARHFGEPFADSSAIPTWIVSKLARTHVTVALSGDGGDELFAGYSWTHWDARAARYAGVPQALRRLVDAALRAGPDSVTTQKLRRFSAGSFLPPAERFRLRHLCFDGPLRTHLLRSAVIERARTQPADRFLEHALEAKTLDGDTFRLWHDLRMYLPDDILTKVDRMTMAHGLEARVPLLDRRIVDFAFTLPYALKCRGGVSKRVIKAGMRGLLPPEVLKQRKRGFAVPIDRWFRENLREALRNAIESPGPLASFVNLEVVRSIERDHVTGRENHGHKLWAVVMFWQWLEYLRERHRMTVGLEG